MMRSTFSITTIASSTTMPIASTMPNSDSWLIVKPTAHMPRKPPISATGITSVAMIVARKFCRNSSMTRNTSTIASTSVLTTSSIEILMKRVVSYGTNHDTPGGNVGCSSSSLARDLVGDGQRVGAADQLHAEAGDALAVVHDALAVTVRPEFDARDILQAHRGAVVVGAQDDVLELLGRGEAAFGAHRRGEADARRRRFRADRTGRDLHVLRAHRGQRLRRRHAVAVQLVGIEPDAHRIFGAELERVADALQARDLVDDCRTTADCSARTN